MDMLPSLSIIIFSEHSSVGFDVQEKTCLGPARLVCYYPDRASCEIPGHSGLWTNETEEAERMSVKTTFLSLFVILVCLLVGLVFATNLVIRHQRESARFMHR